MSRNRIGETKAETKPVGTRLPVELEQRAQRVAAELSKQARGVPVTLSAALHLIIERGLDAMEIEVGIAKATKPAKLKATAA